MAINLILTMEAKREKGGLYRVGWREAPDKYVLKKKYIVAYLSYGIYLQTFNTHGIQLCFSLLD